MLTFCTVPRYSNLASLKNWLLGEGGFDLHVLWKGFNLQESCWHFCKARSWFCYSCPFSISGIVTWLNSQIEELHSQFLWCRYYSLWFTPNLFYNILLKVHQKVHHLLYIALQDIELVISNLLLKNTNSFPSNLNKNQLILFAERLQQIIHPKWQFIFLLFI